MGNKVDVSSNDLLEYWEDDPETEIILLYLESFGNPRKFSRICRRISRTKPIIAVKGGRSAAGARAASSHTGALAGATAATDALFRQAGVIQVNSIEEMFSMAQVLASQPLPNSNRVAIVTNAGGPGILASDACEAWGLNVVPLSDETRAELRSGLPPEASVGNPVDILASASPDHYRHTLSAVLKEPAVDAVLVIYIPPLVTGPEEIAAAVREAVTESQTGKPVVTCFMMSRGAPAELRLDDERYIPSFVFPEDAVLAMARVSEYAQFRQMPEGRRAEFPDIDTEAARSLLHSAAEVKEEKVWLPSAAAMKLLKIYGIPVVETATATSAVEAAGIAAELGFPVAMKLSSTTIVHKTDVGGVFLGLASEEEVERAYESIATRLRELDREKEMAGVVIQPMVTGGQEVIAGISSDPLFGPLMMVGLGGIHVELVKDVAFSLHPLTDMDADRMLARLRSLPLLTGYRGSPPRDVESLKDVLLRFSALIEDLPEIDQIEVNPIMVLNEKEGCSAVDARVRVRLHRGARSQVVGETAHS